MDDNNVDDVNFDVNFLYEFDLPVVLDDTLPPFYIENELQNAEKKFQPSKKVCDG